MSGKGSQAKGRAAELELCRLLNDRGYAVRPGRALNYGTEPDIVGLDGLHLEVKRHERLELSAWLRQAQEDSEKFHDGIPVVIHRQNRSGWQVTATLDDFLKIYAGSGKPTR